MQVDDKNRERNVSDQEKRQIVERLEGVVQPGSSWIVRGIANDVLVEPHDIAASNQKSHFSNALTTQLDRVNQQISSSGGLIPAAIILMTVLICVGIHLDWFVSLMGEKNLLVQSIWFYLISFVISFFVSGYVAEWFEKRTYRRMRAELMRQIADDGLTLADVYVKIRDDEDLGYVSRWIQLDDSFADSNELSNFQRLH